MSTHIAEPESAGIAHTQMPTRSPRRVGILLHICLIAFVALSAIPVILLYVDDAAPLYVAALLTFIDLGIVIALLRMEYSALALTGVILGALVVALLAIHASQLFAHTPAIVASAATPAPHPVATLERVELNGSTQWVSIRGRDLNNPVLLFLAGGPGGSELVMTRRYLSALEEHFVVVNWDQPGTGKSYAAAPIRSLTPEHYLADGLALTTWLQDRFHQEKIYLLGESWGSILGVWMAQQHPEHYHALVTTGQMINTTENDRIGYDLAIDYLIAQGRSTEVERLRRNGPPPYTGRGMAQRYMAYMNVQNEQMTANARGEGVSHNLLFDSLRAPEYGLLDKVNWVRGLAGVYAQVYPQLADLDLITQAPQLDLPVYLIKGRWDINALNSLAETYFKQLEAPHKELIWFEESAHTPLWDEPAHFVDVMVNTVLTQTQPSTRDQTTLTGYLDTQIPGYLREFGIPGAVVSVVQDGALVYQQGYGFADLTQRTPMDAERSVVHIGSAGKTFTTVALLQLVEQGLADLDADVGRYIDFAIPATYAEPITLRHLLSHTSGFAAHDAEAILSDAAQVPSTRDYLVRNLPRRASAPGEVVGYSNYGMTLAGYVVERLSGMSLGDYITTHILAPLEMMSSAAELIPTTAHLEQMATGYTAREARPVEYIAAYGAAPVRATAADMARYMLAHLNLGALGDARILGEQSALAMQTRQIDAQPRQNVTGLGLYELSHNGEHILGHLGSTGYFHSLMLLIPERNLGLFVSFNAAEGAHVLRSERFMRDLADAFFPQVQQAKTPPADFSARADEYSGTYVFNNLHGEGIIDRLLGIADAVTIRPTEDGRLRLAAHGSSYVFTEIAPDLFERSDGADILVFHRDQMGGITGATLNSRPVFTLIRRDWFGLL